MPPAVSMDLTEAARYVQVFKINGFTVTKEKPGYTASTVCAVGGLDWRIEFHPKSSNPHRRYDASDWIMLRLRLISRGGATTSGVAASFSCRLMDPSSPAGSYLDPEEITSSVFHENHSLEIFLARRTDLQGSSSGSQRQYVKDDSILVQCAINVLADGKPPKYPAAAKASLRVPSSDLRQQFGELLRSNKGADVTFLVAGEHVAAHRSVLAARSPVFMAELFGDDDIMKEEKAAAPPCVVEVKGLEVEVFRAMHLEAFCPSVLTELLKLVVEGHRHK
ncbi:hypothetical protein HU200_059147 [Digitaria exilis]|uniref:Uncharacterized protein n=1 Tax=Digitaria exilis TaxID=1010633 RepID=A0A835ACW3_9POAL|nr:hypothetical protein HU200_059147 [Digitaria exilis]